ncbi:hypothetical protein M405DRAFT_173869 [Rhizopogon salebrosus TDB-379]|nr:hypothetical protein M405DRAFT_173869 [Rhizopogon salebrosus TDB-379]
MKGLVIRATPAMIPNMEVAVFHCLAFSRIIQVEIDYDKVQMLLGAKETSTGDVRAMFLISNRCEFADRHVIWLQETPDAVPNCQTPHTMSLGLHDELIDVRKPGVVVYRTFDYFTMTSYLGSNSSGHCHVEVH